MDQQDNNGQGLITRPNEERLRPSLLAEQQRAKSEIEASLTIAAARPRDQKAAMDRILVSCQRIGLAEQAEYEYSRGGTAIQGASITLLEVVAQNYGNVTWGFREMTRLEGVGSQPGESIVEAYAWDLETNARTSRQFVVKHRRDTKGGGKSLVDERDIYELIANMGQRRVRTCLENVIPRDIVESAVEECRKTLREKAPVTTDSLAKLCEAFAQFGVSKEQIETRLQRRIDTMTPAQFAGMRRIWKSLDDGMSHADEWFQATTAKTPNGATETQPAKQTATEKAKEALKADKKAEKQQEPKEEPPAHSYPADSSFWLDYNTSLADAPDVDTVSAARDFHLAKCESEADKMKCLQMADQRFASLQNPPKRGKKEQGSLV